LIIHKFKSSSSCIAKNWYSEQQAFGSDESKTFLCDIDQSTRLTHDGDFCLDVINPSYKEYMGRGHFFQIFAIWSFTDDDKLLTQLIEKSDYVVNFPDRIGQSSNIHKVVQGLHTKMMRPKQWSNGRIQNTTLQSIDIFGKFCSERTVGKELVIVPLTHIPTLES